MAIKNPFLIYAFKLIATFCLLYFGTKAIIGLTVPDGYYSPIVTRYFNYPTLLRNSLLNGTRLLVAVFGYDTWIRDTNHINLMNGRGVVIVYSCLGYGILSFWIAFIFANKGSFVKKIKWMLGGCFIIWMINVIRISLVLVAVNKNGNPFFTMDEHTLYNIITYACIFLMIWLFQRSEKKQGLKINKWS